MTLGQGLELGPIHLPIFRLLILIGIARVIVKNERIAGGVNALDKIMLAWAAWVIFASFFHNTQTDAGPVYACGVVYNLLLFYLLVRVWCSDIVETTGIILIIAILLIPIAVEMSMEKVSGRNLFSYFGGVPEYVLIREGKLRAQGPFLHPILAGTVGATCIPLFLGIYQRYRLISLAGICAGVTIVLASASSGPIISLMAGLFAMVMWRFRRFTRVARYGALAMYIVLMFAMSRPPYYLIGEIDLSGGSTGWHRSLLIDQTLRYFSEWWLIGTDYTRHWMPDQGVASSPTHTDITNYYIGFAVGGGLLSVLLVILAIVRTFGWVGLLYRYHYQERPDKAFMIWCFGSSLFAHVVTGISVSYFDQSFVFFWLNLAVVSSMYSAMMVSLEATEDSGILALETADDISSRASLESGKSC